MPTSKLGTAYDLTGSDDAPVVALIHGLGLSRGSTWGEIAPVLARRYRVLSYDLCGHGESAVPEPETVNLTLLSEQLVSLLDELNIDQAALVGFSLGGMINRRCALDHAGRVSALAILNSPHERGDVQQRLVEERARDTGEGGPAANLDVTLARWFTEDFRRDHSNIVDAVRQVVLANHHANYAAHRQVLAEGVIELIRPLVPIKCPTMVLTCEHDSGSTPAMSHAIAKEIPDAETVIVSRLQHLGLIEKPQIFAEHLERFLGRHLG